MINPPSGNEAGLIGYWDFNEGNGNTVNDLTPEIMGQSMVLLGAQMFQLIIHPNGMFSMAPQGFSLDMGQRCKT